MTPNPSKHSPLENYCAACGQKLTKGSKDFQIDSLKKLNGELMKLFKEVHSHLTEDGSKAGCCYCDAFYEIETKAEKSL